MPDLYNTETRKVENIENEDELMQAVSSGSHSFKRGSKVYATNPYGEKVYIPAEEAESALAQGYKLHSGTTEVADRYVRDNKGLKGASKVFFGQAIDEAALGIPELVYDKTQSPLDVAKKEALKKHYEALNIAGGLTGAVGSMLYGGPLFKGASKAGEVTSKAVTKALSARAAGEVSEGAIKKFAKDITAGAVGTGVEGALLSAPYAFTEAVLGDKEDAAETLMLGMGVGSLFGAGGKMIGGLGKLSKSAAARLSPESQYSSKDLAKKLTKVFTGVPEDDIAHYVNMVKNARHLNVKPLESIKNELDDVYFNVRNKFDDATEKLAAKKSEVSELYKNKVRELGQEISPLAVADDLVAKLDEQKAVLGSLSEQADDMLGQLDGSVKKNDLVRFVDKIIDDVSPPGSPAVGEKFKAAIGKMQTLKDDLVKFEGAKIPYPRLRDIMRQVRADINWNTMAGEFNETSNRLRKTFTEKISDVIKDASPEYKKLMAEMAELSTNLETMSKRFGDSVKARGALDKLFKKSTRSAEDMRLLQEFDKLTDAGVMRRLENFKRSKELFDKAKERDISGLLLPEQTADLKRMESLQKRFKDEFEKIKRLSPNSTQNAIQNQARKNANIEITRALEAAQEMSGKDFKTMIKDFNTYESFFKERTQGTRRTFLGAAIGSIAGSSMGPLGVAAGAAAGASADIYAGRLVKFLIDKNPRVAGMLFTEQAMKQTALKLDGLKDILRRMSDRKKKMPTAKTTAMYGINRIFQDKEHKGKKQPATAKEYKIKRIEKIREELNEWVNNPTVAGDKIAQITQPIASEGAPEIANALNQKMSKAVLYLQDAIPKPVAPDSLFAPKATYQPPEYEVNAFLQKADIVADPFAAFDELEAGTLTLHHMDALKTVYPGIHRYMVETAQKIATEEPLELSYQDRLRLSILFGEPVDQSVSPERVMKYQGMYNKPAEDRPGTEQININGDIGSDMMTNSQRLS